MTIDFHKIDRVGAPWLHGPGPMLMVRQISKPSAMQYAATGLTTAISSMPSGKEGQE